ncbi:MAG: type Z 30S ribosomal protein S14 [Bacillota bacterium]|nr:MAG: type Z 30S ribosomal protein S14 [Bacillota bacterium]
MTRKALVEKWKREQKYKVRTYNRCRVCGRPRAYMGRFGMCRMCFRERAHRGLIPGIRKASW